ncbi:MAG: calcium/sodium antiporter [Ignavibacteriaceae bacterium]
MTFEVIIILVLGLTSLFIGAEGLIRGSSNLAIKVGITPLVVGLTIVAFGTGTPELVVSLKAALIGNSSISLGNVVGSNIANVALIVGVSAIIRPLNVHANVIKREIPIMIGVSILLLILLLDGELGFIEGLLFIIGIIYYTVVNISMARKEKHKVVVNEFREGLKSNMNIPVSIVVILGGLGLLILGAHYFLNSAISIAKAIGVSDAIIGLTVVAFGTSLPELITAGVASYKKESDIAIGNVVGSNIFNILGILGITALIIPIKAGDLNYIDLGVMLLAALILLPLSKTGFKISRVEGIFLVVGYIVYIYYLLPS